MTSLLSSMLTRRVSLLLVASLFAAGLPFPTLSEGIGTITVEQRPAPGFAVLGNWILLKPDGSRTTTNVASHTYEEAQMGGYLLNVLPPSGMSAKITLTLDGETTVIEKPQVAFQLSEGSTISLIVDYTLSLAGKVSVDSTPPGLGYTLSGPDGATYEGTTPGFYDPMPIGLYSVTFDPIQGCPTPAPQSGRLIKEGRVTLSVQISCSKLPELPAQQTEEKKYRFVEATIDGASVIFEDVPIGQWFSASIQRVLDAKVMSGYRDNLGKPTGVFGPTDPVTVAELAKITHRLAGIDETNVQTEPENERAQGTWFAPFVASAEERDWLLFLNRSMNPLRPATRAEVVATFLQALNVKREWPTGEMFTDVPRTLPYADCIETAAKGGLVGGYLDGRGNPTGTFGPFDPINRAEMAKVISNAMDLYLKDTPSFQPD